MIYKLAVPGPIEERHKREFIEHDEDDRRR